MTFVVECDDRSLARKMGIGGTPLDADALMQKVFDHTIYLSAPPPRVNAQVLERFGRDQLKIESVALDVVQAGIGANPRQTKRVIERISLSRAILSKRIERKQADPSLAKNLAPVAFLEVIKERWPSIWHKIVEDDLYLDACLSETPPNEIAQVDDSATLLSFLGVGKGLAPGSWTPFVRLHQSGQEVASGIDPHRIEIDIMQGEFESLVLAAARARQTGNSDAFITAVLDGFPTRPDATVRRRRYLSAALYLVAQPGYGSSGRLKEAAYSALTTGDVEQVIEGVDHQAVISLLGTQHEKPWTTLQSVVELALKQASGTPGKQCDLWITIIRGHLVRGSIKKKLREYIASLGRDRAQWDDLCRLFEALSSVASSPVLDETIQRYPVGLLDSETLRSTLVSTFRYAHEHEKPPRANDLWSALLPVIANASDEERQTAVRFLIDAAAARIPWTDPPGDQPRGQAPARAHELLMRIPSEAFRPCVAEALAYFVPLGVGRGDVATRLLEIAHIATEERRASVLETFAQQASNPATATVLSQAYDRVKTPWNPLDYESLFRGICTTLENLKPGLAPQVETLAKLALTSRHAEMDTPAFLTRWLQANDERLHAVGRVVQAIEHARQGMAVFAAGAAARR
ncbi:MAG: hypothetical protein AB1725_12490, partial [Armatimonadota bacterium]